MASLLLTITQYFPIAKYFKDRDKPDIFPVKVAECTLNTLSNHALHQLPPTTTVRGLSVHRRWQVPPGFLHSQECLFSAFSGTAPNRPTHLHHEIDQVPPTINVDPVERDSVSGRPEILKNIQDTTHTPEGMNNLNLVSTTPNGNIMAMRTGQFDKANTSSEMPSDKPTTHTPVTPLADNSSVAGGTGIGETAENSIKHTEVIRAYKAKILQLEIRLWNQRIECETHMKGLNITAKDAIPMPKEEEERIEVLVGDNENIEVNINDDGMLTGSEVSGINESLVMSGRVIQQPVKDLINPPTQAELPCSLPAMELNEQSHSKENTEETRTVYDQEWQKMKNMEDTYFGTINWDDDEDFPPTSNTVIGTPIGNAEVANSNEGSEKVYTGSLGHTGKNFGAKKGTYAGSMSGSDCGEKFTEKYDSGYFSGSDAGTYRNTPTFEANYARLMMNLRIHTTDGVENHHDYFRKVAARNSIRQMLPCGQGWTWHDYPGCWTPVIPTVLRAKGIVGVRYGREGVQSGLRMVEGVE